MKHFVTKSTLSVISQTFFLNLFSVPVFILLSLCGGEHLGMHKLAKVHQHPTSLCIIMASCFFGLGIGLLSFALRKQISAASFTLVGNTCKLVTIMLNSVVWDKHASQLGTFSVLMCLLSTVFYEQAPKRDSLHVAGQKAGVPEVPT